MNLPKSTINKIDSLVEEAFKINWNPFSSGAKKPSGKTTFIEPGGVNSSVARSLKDELNAFFNKHGWDNVPEDVVGDEVAISLVNGEVVAIWEFQYSSHCYLNPFGINDDIKDLSKVIDPIVKYLSEFKEDNPEISPPKEYKNKASKLPNVKVDTISRYVGSITLELKYENR